MRQSIPAIADQPDRVVKRGAVPLWECDAQLCLSLQDFHSTFVRAIEAMRSTVLSLYQTDAPLSPVLIRPMTAISCLLTPKQRRRGMNERARLCRVFVPF
jgi:hypothetical protein